MSAVAEPQRKAASVASWRKQGGRADWLFRPRAAMERTALGPSACAGIVRTFAKFAHISDGYPWRAQLAAVIVNAALSRNTLLISAGDLVQAAVRIASTDVGRSRSCLR